MTSLSGIAELTNRAGMLAISCFGLQGARVRLMTAKSSDRIAIFSAGMAGSPRGRVQIPDSGKQRAGASFAEFSGQ